MRVEVAVLTLVERLSHFGGYISIKEKFTATGLDCLTAEVTG